MRLVPISGRKLCKVLERLGFEKIHQVGSHARYKHPDGRITVVPVHGNEEVGKGLLGEILKQTKISRKEFDRLRRKV
ncbi:MAG: type II toxin-antitoxin system HicA family toxin [Candidatus Altiarchaeales archaeon]|nr:type II toxin-antitoxin system HicA family toxin [Candidatus Altiarchaeota archaeon]MBU4341732.1 type II toxin-antitoxin system HicA family toxin [Candidatus Altiarchaeota archaeon]MBU4436895.1 type II toxin-antitoxin system HicA family toxin [Candidatus Altiarchaeota archaeon]MCG2782687.1 type II toxin-antitoxin system HicA family toxin [Candidatus Altiarchaeales archaeon]